MKTYRKSPLPFLGQKYRQLSYIDAALPQIPHGATVVDLFGGSGLLSHYIKRKRPDLHVIYNDFDGFAERLYVINKTNEHLAHIAALITAEYDTRLNEQDKEVVIEYLEQQLKFEFEYVDLVTIASNIQFGGKSSGTLEQLRKNSMYNKLRRRPYSTAPTYLDGLEVVNDCALNLIEQNKGAVFIVDPPYLDTHEAPYGSGFTRQQHAELLTKLIGEQYVYFSGLPERVTDLASEIGSNVFFGANIEAKSNKYNYHAVTVDGCFTKLNGVSA